MMLSLTVQVRDNGKRSISLTFGGGSRLKGGRLGDQTGRSRVWVRGGFGRRTRVVRRH